MKNVVDILFAISFMVISSAQATIPPIQIDRIADQFMTRNHAPGLAIAMYDNGKEVLVSYGVANQKTRQPISNDTYFEIGSITKSFTAIILAQAVMADKVFLEQNIAPFLPAELKDKPYSVDELTFKELATHTASLPKDPDNYQTNHYTLKDMLAWLKEWRPQWPPSTRYHYSNVGFGLIGIAMEGVYKQSFAGLLNVNLLIPLNMKHTFDKAPEDTTHYATGYDKRGRPTPPHPYAPWRPAAGSIRSNNKDMLTFLKANLLVGPLSNDMKEAISLTQQPYFLKQQGSIGLAWEISDHQGMTVLSKGGKTSGFTSYITFIPEKKIGVVVMTNKNVANIPKLANALLSRMAINK